MGLAARACGPAAEALDAPAGIDQLLPAGVEGMAVRADLHMQLRLRGAGPELVAARAAHVGRDVLGVDVGLHSIFESSDRRTASGRLVVRTVAPLRWGQAAALRGDRSALDAVRRRDVDLDLAPSVQLAVRPSGLELALGHLVHRRWAHVLPHQRDLEWYPLLHADVVGRVVARRVARREHRGELVERDLSVGLRVALVAIADEDVDG